VRPEYRLIALLNSVDKASTVQRGNEVRREGAHNARPRLVLRALVAGWAPARAELIEAGGSETLGQVLNPNAGKGTNRQKPDGPSRNNLTGPLLGEMLKYAGLYSHAYARSVKRSDTKSDVEMMVPVPDEIPLRAAEEVMAQLRAAPRVGGGPGVQLDVLAVLEYARLLAQHHRAAAINVLLRRGRVNRLVSGMQVAYFQDLGGGKPVTAIYLLGLPGFFDLRTPPDVDAYLDVVAEHAERIRSLDPSRSDHVSPLLQYRDFLSSGTFRTFLEFMVTFGELVLKSSSERQHFRRLRALESANIDRLVEGEAAMKLGDVVSDPGFRNVARAIRRSTVGELYWKEEKNDQRYEVRYGLGQELRRLAPKPTRFLAAIASFAHSYNEENAKVRARERELPAHRRRADITDADLDSVVRLVSEANDPESAALLLVGYGYARETRDGGDTGAKREGESNG
jgi:hypothetical protein